MVSGSYFRPGGRPPTGVLWLLLGFFAALVIFVFWGSASYPSALALVPDKAFGALQLWRPLTGLIYFGELHAVAIAPFLLGMTALWLLGSPLEGWLGRWRLLILFFTCAVVGHLGAALLGLAMKPLQPLGGASPGVWGVITATGIIFYNTQVFVVRPLPLRGKHLLIALAVAFGIAFLVDLADGSPLLPFAASGLGGLVGAAFVTQSWRPWTWFGPEKRRQKFVVLRGGRETRPRSGNGNGKGNGRSRGRWGDGSGSDRWN